MKQSILLYQQVDGTMRKLKPRSDSNQATWGDCKLGVSVLAEWAADINCLLDWSFYSLGGPALSCDNILVSFWQIRPLLTRIPVTEVLA